MNQASTLKELFQSVIESSTGTVTNDLYHITASGWIGTITISNNNNNNAVLIQGGPKKVSLIIFAICLLPANFHNF